MKKRILSMFLALVMLVSLVPTSAMATSTPEIYVDTSGVGDLKEGDTVSVSVAIKNNPGICMAYLELDIPNVLTYVSIEEKTGADNIVWTAPNKVQWEYDTDYTENYSEDGALFVLNFTVNEGATAGNYNIGVGLLNGVASNLGDAEGDVTATFTSGSIKVVYETTGLTFNNGTQTGLTYDDVKAEALGTEGAVTLATPGEGYYFAGWFTGLDVTADANGFYVVDATTTTFTGTEFLPRYDTPPAEGEYHALWVKGDGSSSYVLAQNGTTNTVCTDMATAISTANGGTVKLLHDLTLSAAITTAVNLDLNGCTVSHTQVFNAQSSAVSILSSRAGGTFTSTDGYNTNKFGSLTMKDCTHNYTGTNAYASPIIVYGASTIDNCVINTKGRALQVQDGATATITNTTVTSTSAQAPFMGVGNIDGSCTGTIVLGAGNTVTATSAAQLFYKIAAINFAATDGTYQISPTGVLYSGDNTPTITVADGKSYGFSNGVLQFGTPCTVTYKAVGNTDITKTAMVGANADLSVSVTYGDGKEYKHDGWTTVEGGIEPLTELVLEGDTTLYSIKQEMDILINGDEVSDTTYTKAVHGSTMPFMHFENVKKLGNLEAFTLTNGKYQITLKADALDSIAQSCVSSSVTAAAISLVNDSTNMTETAAARVKLSVNVFNGNWEDQTGNTVIPFTGAVEVKIPFTPDASKNYRAYYIPESGEPEAFATQIVTEGSTTYAVFTTTHFSAFEVRETTVAEGYTAALDITETEVRAGGNTVNATVTVSHSSDTTFNAAELKISYDPTLLTPVTTGLAEGTFKVENGVLTIEDYGADKTMAYTYNLQFTTCASVDADTTATITLQSAAFADKADAVSEDLITATLEPASDIVTIQLEAFAVTKDDDVVTGNSEAVKLQDYEFSIDKDEHYTYEVTATVGEGDAAQSVTVTESTTEPGNYTIAGTDVTGPIEITVVATANQYDVTFKGETPAANDGAKATHDTAYTFTLPTKAQWQYSYAITIAGAEYTGATSENNVVTIPGDAITGEIEITISCEQTEFNITVDGSDYTIADEDTDGNYEKGEDVTITITPAEGYTYTVTAVKTGTDEAVTVTQNGNVWTIADISSDLTITVTKTLIGTVTITEYLTLDADNTDGTSSSMFLVIYEGNLADGYIPYCNDNAMYWSSQYNAYCYLVIDETLAMAEENTVVSVKSGTMNAITYTKNVNGSTNTDAADAQLVYDMYQAEYSDFTTVSMLKFLLADVNNSKTVNTEDAAAIISYVLNPTAAG